MKTTIKFLLGLLLCSAAVYAEMNDKSNELTGPVLCDVNPFPAKDECCYNWHVDLGLLYQQPAMPDLYSGYLYSPSFPADTTGGEFADQTITVLQNCFDYSIGLTSSLGVVTKHDGWSIQAKFEWLQSNFSRDENPVDQPTLLIRPVSWLDKNIFVGSGFDFDTDSFTRVGHVAAFEMFNLDVVLKRGSFFSKCASFSPYAGVKALWYRQEHILAYSSPNLDTGNFIVLVHLDKNACAGPMAGFLLEYFFLENISLFSDSDIGVLYAETLDRVTTSMTGALDAVISEDRVIHNLRSSDCQVFLPVRSILGIQFARYCYEDQHYVSLKVGYDARLLISYPSTEHGFAMGGLYAKFAWDF